MGTKEEVLKALEHWGSKLDDEEIKERFEDYNKTIEFHMKDIDEYFQLIIENQAAQVKVGKADSPAIRIITTSDVIIGITDGEVDPEEAYMTGELEAKGNMPDLMKLQVLMDEDDDDD